MKMRERLPQQDRTEDLEDEEKLPFFATHRGRMFSALFLMVILIAFMALQAQSGGAVSYEMDRRQLAVACMDRAPVFIPYDQIRRAELVRSFPMDRYIEAADWDSGWCGTYESEAYGCFTLCAYTNPGLFILVEHEDGTLIFNVKTEKGTQLAWEELAAHLPQAGAGEAGK